MTIFSSVFRTDWLAADGVNKDWSYAFSLAEDDVVVEVRDADGVITTFTSNYEFFPTDDSEGFVRYPSVGDALAAGNSVRISRDVPYTQPTAIGSQGRFHPEIHEGALDRATIQIQQLKDFADRSPKVPAGDTAGLWDVGAENELVAFGADGGGKPAGHSISDLQGIENAAAEAAADAAESAAEAAAAAESAAAVNARFIESRATAEATNIPPVVTFIQTAGFADPGDEGGALYKEAVGSTPGGFPSADGGWWELVGSPHCKAYGAKCDGVTDDSAAVLLQYARQGKIILPPNTTTVLSSWVTQSPAALVEVLGENSVIKNLNDELFNLQDGSGLIHRGVSYDAPAAAVIALDSAANLSQFVWDNSNISNGLGITPAAAGCLDVDNLRVENSVFESLTDDLFTMKANIKKATIVRNTVNGITTTGNSAQAFVLGKTQLADQPNTGDYYCAGNKIKDLEAQGTGIGEIHGFLLYGSRAIVTDNIIMDLSRTGASANQEGIEGIYTKVRNVNISDNVLIRAGVESGNKNAAINHKGLPLNAATAEDEGPYFVISNNTIEGIAGAPQSGIRCEGDHGVISDNQISLCYYSINVTASAVVENVGIFDNVMSQCQGPAGMRLNITCDTVKISGNVIEKATSPYYTADGGFGIQLTTSTRTGDVKHLNISDNEIVGAWDYGIVTQFVAPSICYDLAVLDNHIIGTVYGIRNHTDAQINDGHVAGNVMDVTQAFRDQSTKLFYENNTNGGVPVSPPEYEAVATNADFTLTPFVSGENIYHTGTLTATRTVTLSTTNARKGRSRFRITRTGLGAFNLNIGAGTALAALAPGEWAEVVYDGAAWKLAARGRLGSAVEVYVPSFGLVGDGTTANDTALQSALAYAFRDADSYTNINLVFPAGDFLFTSNNPLGQWASTPAARNNIRISGAGKYVTTLTFRPSGAGPFWFYDGENAGTGRDQQIIGGAFENFALVLDGTNVSSGTVNAFKAWPKSGFPTQNLQFINCYFKGEGAASTYGTVLEVRGTINGSENTFINCTGRNLLHILALYNDQAVNHVFLNCHWELITGDFYYVEKGGSITHVGGSLISSGATADAYLLNAPATASGLTGGVRFIGVRTELRNAFGKLVRLTGNDNGMIVKFEACDLRTVTGGARTAVSVVSSAAVQVHFESCEIPAEILYDFTAGTASYWFSSGHNAEIHLVRCRVPTTIHSLVTWAGSSAANGLFRVESCSVGNGGSVASVAGIALDCDMTAFGPARSRHSSGARLKTAQGFVTYWPQTTQNTNGVNSRVMLPPEAFIDRIRVRKRATGSATASYQLAVINDDGTFCYGLSTVGQFKAQHEVLWETGRMVASGVDLIVRVINTITIAYNTQTANFTLGETVTGGTSGATGKVLADTDAGATGTLTLGLVTGTFQVAELLTGSTSGGATVGTVTLNTGSAEIQTMDAGDMFAINYY